MHANQQIKEYLANPEAFAAAAAPAATAADSGAGGGAAPEPAAAESEEESDGDMVRADLPLPPHSRSRVHFASRLGSRLRASRRKIFTDEHALPFSLPLLMGFTSFILLTESRSLRLNNSLLLTWCYVFTIVIVIVVVVVLLYLYLRSPPEQAPEIYASLRSPLALLASRYPAITSRTSYVTYCSEIADMCAVRDVISNFRMRT